MITISKPFHIPVQKQFIGEELNFTKKVLWLIKVSSTFTDESIDYTGNGFPWSSAVGGNQPIQQYTGTFSDQLPSCLNFTSPSQANFCFVPVVSALDIQGERDLLKGYRAENDLQNSKFDNFYTEPYKNRIHTEFNTGNSNWIITELDNDNVLRSAVYKMTDCTINGDDLICSGSVYSISNLPAGAKLKWIYSDNISCFSINENNTTMSAKDSDNGWVKAEISGGGAIAYSQVKNVWVGSPVILADDYLMEPEEPGSGIFCRTDYFSAENSIRIENKGTNFQSQYDWDAVSNNFGYNTYKNRIDIQPYKKGIIAFKVRANNSCGWSEWGIFQYLVVECDGNGSEGELFMMSYPNPANEYTTLNFYEADEISEYQKSSSAILSAPAEYQSNEMGEYEIQIWHERKGLVKRMKSKRKKLQIPTNNLEEGIYFLHVIVNGKVHKQQLKIQR